ncbi:hypothetical protein PsAD2_01321 [Pseudovibrio axinellae]|uniref:DUF4164 family protein n=1 Tax=Pseudovibrio axinellae TaxID=989403 RepID=A0A166ABH8_9HYPH|nr:DUF4164 domain-containing protein [Pseudovibrio axinellae]KZL20832.1 hypothetical protein PsAD2_01321 [Pseudovibrio axinellae]SER21230.1 protein of unknown function [Pseudovibrio axinellae]
MSKVKMDSGQDLDQALDRFSASITKLEGALHRRSSRDKTLDALESDVQRIGEDRTQLAAKLDQAEARGARLEDVNKDVSRRLVAAMESIRTVLDGQES